MDNNIFVLKNEVNWSFLNYGFHIKIEDRGLFKNHMADILCHGESRDICIRIEGKDYRAKLVNINFDQERWGNHKDLIQIRYASNSDIARKLRSIFTVSYEFLKAEKARLENKRCPIALPPSINEYYVLNATGKPYVFEMYCFNAYDNSRLAVSMPYLNGQEFENLDNDQFVSDSIANWVDAGASLEERARIVKVRKVDRTIIDNLKYIYDYRCQISGKKVGEEFGRCVIEAHHIDYFTDSQNNDARNIIILSPDYHRIIHDNNPHFNFFTKAFEFDNGVRLGLKLNLHL